MIEKDSRILSLQLRDTLGFVANAKISEEGARRSAEIVVDLEEKIRAGYTHPADLFRAVIAASQLVARWGQLKWQLAGGSIRKVEDTETIMAIQEKFSGGNLPKDEIMRLTAISYVANPSLGANSAMDVLTRLQTEYAEIPLKQQV